MKDLMQAVQTAASENGRLESATLGNDMYELRIFNGRNKQIIACRVLWERCRAAIWLYYDTQKPRYGRDKKEKEAA